MTSAQKVLSQQIRALKNWKDVLVKTESDKLKKNTKMEILETVEKVKAVAVDTDQEAVETQDASQKKELMS